MRTLDNRVSTSQVAVAAMLFLGSYPVVQAIHLQQMALLIFGLIALSIAAIDRQMFSVAGVVLALAMVKPQTTMPVAGWFLFWALASWTDRKMLFISFLAAMIVLCAGASVLLPGWLRDWRAGASSYMACSAGGPGHVHVIFE